MRKIFKKQIQGFFQFVCEYQLWMKNNDTGFGYTKSLPPTWFRPSIQLPESDIVAASMMYSAELAYMCRRYMWDDYFERGLLDVLGVPIHAAITTASPETNYASDYTNEDRFTVFSIDAADVVEEPSNFDASVLFPIVAIGDDDTILRPLAFIADAYLDNQPHFKIPAFIHQLLED